MARFIYIQAGYYDEAPTDIAFRHCYTEAMDEDRAYTYGWTALSGDVRPLNLLNDYVIEVEKS